MAGVGPPGAVEASSCAARTSAGTSITPKLAVKGGIYNINDKRLDDATYGTVNYGRTFWMGVSADF